MTLSIRSERLASLGAADEDREYDFYGLTLSDEAWREIVALARGWPEASLGEHVALEPYRGEVLRLSSRETAVLHTLLCGVESAHITAEKRRQIRYLLRHGEVRVERGER